MIQEWQLWMHPYPTMIKNRTRRMNMARVSYPQIFSDGKDFIRLSEMMEAKKKKHTPPQLKRCVRALVKKQGGAPTRAAISRAFAICTKSLQRKGYLEPGSQTPTEKGETRGKSKAAEKGHGEKVKEYDAMLKGAREQ